MRRGEQVTDAEISRALDRADVSVLAVARELGCGYARVRGIRERRGLPVYQRGRRAAAASWDEALAERLLATPDGHVDWTGARQAGSGTPILHWRERKTTAARAVFAKHYGREPVGKVSQTCEYEHCLHGEHLEDRPMREQRRAREEGADGRVAA
ncbi:hypothetical protein [Streptomyces sp. TRM68367]|uniref:hypothetical protein n=1 Tax=Streptomyces sp. TRM68367 TaxID=2758415 RepID=UPI00165BF7EA|nr:hypothetical protein [Streptomyces sp. TRM68367]MBC9729898.1 hypothetical protein [Streptomyces sp. TRM68367]